MMRFRLACAIGVFLACAALATTPAIADPWQDCKDRVEALQDKRSNDPDLAIEACTKFLETAQGDQAIQGNLYRAIAYFDKHDFYHAVEDFKAVPESKRNQAFYINLGLAYAYQIADDPMFADKAISALTEAEKLQPDVDDKTKAQFWQAYLARAEVKLKNGMDKQAKEDEDAAIQLNPDEGVAIKADFARAYAQRASQSLAGGQLGQAATDLQQASQLDQTTADKLAPYLTEAQSGRPGPYSAIARGDHDEEDQNYEQALIDYADAIKANPNLAVAYLGRAYAYRALDRFEDARADSSEAIRLDPNGWTGFYSRGQLYESIEQFDNAAADFDQASAIIEKAHDWAYKYEKGKIDDARKSLRFSSTLQEHWISYLKEIQAANTHQNWSDAPYNLYVRNHSLQNVAEVEQTSTAEPTRPSVPTSPEPLKRADPEWGLWALGLFGLLAVLGIGWGAFILYRRH